MSGSNIQNLCARTMIDRKLHLDHGDGDVTHYPGFRDIQNILITRNTIIIDKRRVNPGDLPVIRLCLGKKALCFAIVQLSH